MSSFIRFQNAVLNTKYITHINHYKDVYHINLVANSFNGLMFLGFGTIDTENTLYVVSKDKNKEDYDKIARWISKLE